jgi:hypothetical protein
MNTTRTSRLTRLALAAPIAVAAAFAGTTIAQADTPPPPQPLPAKYCGFPVILTTLRDNSEKPSTNPGPSTGNFIVQFIANGKSATFNVSGATQPSTISGTTGTQIFTGPSYNLFGTQSQINTGQPGIVYSTGRTVVTYDTTTGPNFVALSFSSTAPVTNVCALLS